MSDQRHAAVLLSLGQLQPSDPCHHTSSGPPRHHVTTFTTPAARHRHHGTPPLRRNARVPHHLMPVACTSHRSRITRRASLTLSSGRYRHRRQPPPPG